ncbi:MAG: extracellular solute-binding protein [Vallitalea sp.]|jgi:putative aldouronate transport system substrate-binding protein|nr:extracellular solute-binding protein [Vallitalea sp.]
MKAIKKVLSILLTLCLVISIAGCAKEEATKTTETGGTESVTKKDSSKKSSQTDSKDEISSKGDHPYWVSDKLVTLSYFEMSASPWKDDTPVAKKITEMTNVMLKGSISQSQTDEKQAYSLMIASGQIPDIVHYSNRDELFKHGAEGAFLVLNDLIKKHAPNIQKYIDEDPEIRKAISDMEGNIYYVPQIRDGITAQGYYIREDWLKNLGLEVPTTVDELYKVLVAFRDNDANGNGNSSDEVPYFSRNTKTMRTDLVRLFDAYPDIYLDGNQYKYGPIEENFKTAISNLSKWYDEGLIDQEVFTRGGSSRDIMLNDNLGGMTHDWFGSTASYNDRLKDSIEGFSWQPMLPPATLSGKIIEGTSRSRGLHAGSAISSQSKNTVEAIKFLDFCFSQAGRSLLNFGIEGEDYNLVDGKEIFNDSILKAENGALGALRKRGAQLEMAFHQDFEYEKQWANEIALKGMELYINADCIISPFPLVNYTDEENEKKAKLMSAINTYVDEKVQQWLLGVNNIDDEFEDFVAEVKAMGIEEVLEINTTALNR